MQVQKQVERAVAKHDQLWTPTAPAPAPPAAAAAPPRRPAPPLSPAPPRPVYNPVRVHPSLCLVLSYHTISWLLLEQSASSGLLWVSEVLLGTEMAMFGRLKSRRCLFGT